MVQLFRRPFLSDEAAATLCRKANAKDAVNGAIASVVTEQCFNVEVTSPLTSDEMATLQWLLRETFEPDLFTDATQLDGDVVEVGPRLAFQSAWSTNAVSICQNTGLGKVTRLERSRRYSLVPAAGKPIDDSAKIAFAPLVHDRMTECVYDPAGDVHDRYRSRGGLHRSGPRRGQGGAREGGQGDGTRL